MRCCAYAAMCILIEKLNKYKTIITKCKTKDL